LPGFSPVESINTVRSAGVCPVFGATNNHGVVPVLLAVAVKPSGVIPSVLVSAICRIITLHEETLMGVTPVADVPVPVVPVPVVPVPVVVEHTPVVSKPKPAGTLALINAELLVITVTGI